MAKKKGKGSKVVSKTRISEAVESAVFDEVLDKSTESAVAVLSMKTVSTAPDVLNARQDVVGAFSGGFYVVSGQAD
jgi:FKBP-type peptidyl-prolyl cis-trans isomerase (trigger factor)